MEIHTGVGMDLPAGCHGVPVLYRGAGSSAVIWKVVSCSDGVKWFQDKGQFKDASYVPAAGDLIFFDWGNDGSIDHVGIYGYGMLGD